MILLEIIAASLALASPDSAEARAKKKKEHTDVGVVLGFAIRSAKMDLSAGCAGDPKKQYDLARRAAAISEERGIRAMWLADYADTSDEKVEYRSASVDIYIETANFWFLAWECRQEDTLSLESAEKVLVTARDLAGDDTKQVATINEISSGIDEARALVESRKPEPPAPLTERFSLRVEVGYGSGRLSRSRSSMSGIFSDKDGFRSHRGAYFSTSVMMRLPATTGIVNFLAGPYYTYWRGAERSSVPETSSANVHEFGARLELSTSLTRKAIPYFTLHPGLEFGLQYVDFDRWNYTEIPGTEGPEYRLDPLSTDMAGGTLGLALGACFLYSSVCGTFRVHAVPMAWYNAVPTLRGGLAIDVVRLVHAILEL